jgi:hypothetical protein
VALDVAAPAATGAVTGVTWGLAGLGAESGGLPLGVTVDPATGAFAGIPREVGVFRNIRLLASASGGAREVSGPVTLTIARPEIKAALVQKDIQVHPGASVASAAPSVEGAMGVVAWSVDSPLPAGTAFDSGTGVLSGTPSAVGAWGPFLPTARDVDGTKAPSPVAFSVEVLPDPVVDPFPAPLTGKAGTNLATDAPVARHVIGKATWSHAGGTLPPGIQVDPASGALKGTTAAVGTFGGISVTVVDETGARGTSLPFSLVVGPGDPKDPAEEPPAEDDGGQATPFTVSIGKVAYETFVGDAFATDLPVATGAAGGVTWERLSGALPPGMGVTTDGRISGAPSVSAAYVLVLRAKDAKNRQADLSQIEIKVKRRASVSAAAPPEGRVGRDYALAFTATGISGTPSWSSKGQPMGLAFEPGTGVLKGKPAAMGTFVVDVQATEAGGLAEGLGSVTIKVLPEIKVTGVPANVAAHERAPFTSPVLGYVGVLGKPEWSGFANLPAWATVNPDIGTFSGIPPAPGTSAGIVLQIKDLKDGATGRSEPMTIEVLPELNVVNMATSYSARYGFRFGSEAPHLLNAHGSAKWDWADPSAVPAWLKLDPNTGVMSGQPDGLGTVTGLMLWGGDATKARAPSVPFSLSVYSQIGVSVSRNDLKARVGDAVSVRAGVSGTVGKAAWSFGTIVGTPPAGLTLGETDGTFGGTVTGPGLAEFTMRATDGHDGAFGDSDTVRVEANPALAVAGMKGSYTGRVGVPMAFDQPTAANVVGNSRWDVTPRPPGLDFDETNGLLSGFPTQAFKKGPVKLALTDAHDGAVKDVSFNVEVLDLLVASGTANMAARTGIDVASRSFTPTAAPARGPIAWELGAGNLPDGVTVDPATGRLKGAPVGYAQTTTFPGIRLRARDVDADALSQSPFSITVWPFLQASTTQVALTVDTEQQTVMAAPSKSGSVGAVTWELVTRSGRAPANAAIDKLSGIVTFTGDAASVGAWSYALKATDDVDASTSEAGPVTVTIKTKPALAYADLTVRRTGDLGVQGLLPTRVAGLTPPLAYTWANAPEGGTIDPATGRLGGVITAEPGVVNGTISVTDSATPKRSASTSALKATVTPSPTAAWTAKFRLGSTTDVAPTAQANLVGPTAYALVGIRPVWPLAINAATGVLTGSPTSKTCPATWQVKVTDGTDAAASVTTSETLTCAVADGPLTIGTAVSGELVFVSGKASSKETGFQNLVGTGSYAVIEGGLPDGLAFGPTGTLSGTTTAPGPSVSTLRVEATDGWDGAKAQMTVTVRVLEAVSLASASAETLLADQKGTGVAACSSVAIVNKSAGTALGIVSALNSAAVSDFEACAAPSAPCGDTLAGGASCNLGVRVKTTRMGLVSGSLNLTGRNFDAFSAAFKGNRVDTYAAGSKLFVADEVWVPPSNDMSVRVFAVNGGGSGYTFDSPVAPKFTTALGQGGNSGYTAYGTVTVTGPVQVRVGAPGIATWNGTKWIEGLGGQTSLGSLLSPSAPRSGAGGSPGGDHIFQGSNTSTATVWAIYGQTGGAAPPTPTAGWTRTNPQGYQGSSFMPPTGYFKSAAISAGAGGRYNTTNIVAQTGCGTAKPPTVFGAGGGGGVVIDGSTAGGSAGGTAPGTTPGGGGLGYGGAGGGHYTVNCAAQSAVAPGAGAPGALYVEWDAK